MSFLRNFYFGIGEKLGYFDKASEIATPKEFGYQECQDIYANFALGKRFVESIIDFSLSTKRTIIVQNAPEEVVEQYEKFWRKSRLDKIVKTTASLCRVYGAVGLFATTENAKDEFKNLTQKDKAIQNVGFNVLDPLNMNFTISQDPKSPNFLKPETILVGGNLVGKARVAVFFNGSPLYVRFTNSALNFAGRSVFANMRRLIELWANLFEALERISIKASSILITNDSIMKNGSDAEVARMSASLVKQMAQGQVAMLMKGQTAEFFNLNGATEISVMIKEVKEALTIALNDTPSQILLDKDLSNGLSNGSEDMRSVIIKVNAFREEFLNPIYDFLDSYIFYQAWDDNFVKKLKSRYSEYFNLSVEQIRNSWIEQFDYEWKSIYPKTPDEETKEEDGKLERLKTVKELGANTEDLQNALNETKIFPNEITLEKQEPLFGMEQEEF